LVLSINYAPEPSGFAPHVTAACEHFVRCGHRVRVVTGFPFAPNWARWPAYRGKFRSRENVNGVEITRLTHYIPRRAGKILQRLAMEGTYCLMLLLFGLVGSAADWDVILYVGAQPSIAFMARGLALLSGAPYAVNINDLAAEAAGDVGIVRRGWLLRLLKAFEFAAYRRAAGAMVLCDSFQHALVAEGYPAERIRIISPPVDLEAIRPVAPDPRFRAEHGLQADDFVILFTGSMGLKQGLNSVIAAARQLQPTHPRIKWVLVGDGEQHAELARQIGQLQLEESVRLLPFQPVEGMSAMYAAADLLLLSQLRTVKDSVIPSKLLTYMAAGRAVLAAVSATSQGAALLRRAEGGWLVAPEDPLALANAAVHAQGAAPVAAAMGRRNRAFAEEHFDLQKIMAAQEAFLCQIVGQEPSPAPTSRP
jgi:colanic acid biosynthesis glycosyl transferase WcaI